MGKSAGAGVHVVINGDGKAEAAKESGEGRSEHRIYVQVVQSKVPILYI